MEAGKITSTVYKSPLLEISFMKYQGPLMFSFQTNLVAPNVCLKANEAKVAYSGLALSTNSVKRFLSS